MKIRAAVSLCLALLGTAPVWGSVYFPKRGSEASGIALVSLAMAGYLSWRYRRDFVFGTNLNPIGLLALGCGIVGTTSGWWFDSHYLECVGAVLTVCGSVACSLEIHSFGKLASIVAVLILGIQLPGSISGVFAVPLAHTNAIFVGMLLQAWGHSNEVLGTLIESESLRVQVVDACDGLNLFWAVLLIAFTQLTAKPCSLRSFVIVLLLAPVLSIALNTTRILVTALLFAETSADTAEFLHDMLGLALMVTAWYLPWCLIGILEGSKASCSREATPRKSEVDCVSSGRLAGSKIAWCFLLLLVGFRLVTLSLGNESSEGSTSEVATKIFSSVPFRIGDFVGIEEPLPKRQLDVLQPNAYLGLSFQGVGTGQRFLLIVTVHDDANDIEKHPVEKCYSNVGWVVKNKSTAHECSQTHSYHQAACHLVRRRTNGFEEMYVLKGSLVGTGQLPLTQFQLVFDPGVEGSTRLAISEEFMKLFRDSYDRFVRTSSYEMKRPLNSMSSQLSWSSAIES